MHDVLSGILDMNFFTSKVLQEILSVDGNRLGLLETEGGGRWRKLEGGGGSELT